MAAVYGFYHSLIRFTSSMSNSSLAVQAQGSREPQVQVMYTNNACPQIDVVHNSRHYLKTLFCENTSTPKCLMGQMMLYEVDVFCKVVYLGDHLNGVDQLFN